MRPLAALGSVTIVAGLVLGCEVVRSIEPVIPESEAIFEPARRDLGIGLRGTGGRYP